MKLSICSRLLLSMLVLGTFGWLAAAPAGSARTWQVVVVAGDDAEPVFDNATRELSFMFASSRGGGADPKPGSGSGDGKTVLKNPTAAQLGEYATAISQGKVRVEYP